MLLQASFDLGKPVGMGRCLGGQTVFQARQSVLELLRGGRIRVPRSLRELVKAPAAIPARKIATRGT